MRLREVVAQLTPQARETLARQLASIQIKMFVADGYFHADLHPGNILFGEDGTLTLLDFGMIGELAEEERDRFILYWYAVVHQQTRRAFHHFKRQMRSLPGADAEAFFGDFAELAERFYSSTVSQTTIAQVYLAMITSGYEHGFAFPANLLLHAKALTSAEALIFTLAPDLRFDALTEPVITSELARRVTNPERLRYRTGQLLPELLLTGEALPPEAMDSYRPDRGGGREWDSLLRGIVAGTGLDGEPYRILRMVLDPAARAVLLDHHPAEEVQPLLETIWTQYAEIEADIPVPDGIGPTLILHLAGATLAANRALRVAGHDEPQSHAILYQIGWRIYRVMGEMPFRLAGGFTEDPHKKLTAATRAFRAFPFGPPAYEWRDVGADADVVAFDCLRCRSRATSSSMRRGISATPPSASSTFHSPGSGGHDWSAPARWRSARRSATSAGALRSAPRQLSRNAPLPSLR